MGIRDRLAQGIRRRGTGRSRLSVAAYCCAFGRTDDEDGTERD